jgi:hypothetical protein
MKIVIYTLSIAFAMAFLGPVGGFSGVSAQEGPPPADHHEGAAPPPAPVYILPKERVVHGVVKGAEKGAATISHEAIGGAGDVVGGIFDGAGQILGGVGKMVGGAINGADRIAGGAIHGSGQIIGGVVDGDEATFVYEKVPVYDSHHKMLGYRMMKVMP